MSAGKRGNKTRPQIPVQIENRIELFRARKAIESKRALVVPEEDQCPFCLEPLAAAADTGVRECPECRSKIDQSGAEVRS